MIRKPKLQKPPKASPPSNIIDGLVPQQQPPTNEVRRSDALRHTPPPPLPPLLTPSMLMPSFDPNDPTHWIRNPYHPDWKTFARSYLPPPPPLTPDVTFVNTPPSPTTITTSTTITRHVPTADSFSPPRTTQGSITNDTPHAREKRMGSTTPPPAPTSMSSRSNTHTLTSVCERSVSFFFARVSDDETERTYHIDSKPISVRVTPIGHFHNVHASNNSNVLRAHVEVPLPEGDRCVYNVVMRREKGAPTMIFEPTALDTDHNEEVLRALAAIGTSGGMTSGGEKWTILNFGGKGNIKMRTIPFSIGRKGIHVFDGSEVVAFYTSRGDEGKYTARLKVTTPTTNVTKREIASGRVSHPQSPWMRVIMENAMSGVMRFYSAKWEWSPNLVAPDAEPQCMIITELDSARAISMPEIHMGIVPVKK